MARSKSADAANAPKPVSSLSPRGVRTRKLLVEAARRIFERDGYLDARIVDITIDAGVSAGTFYTYFESKEEIFAAVLEVLQDDMLHPQMSERLDGDDAIAMIDAANRGYLLSYKSNARLMALLEQVTQIDDEFRQLRRKRGEAFAQRNAKMIRRLQSEGRADPDLDPLVAAHALSSMVSRMAYLTFNLGEKIPFEKLVATVNRLWINALKIDEGGKSS